MTQNELANDFPLSEVPMHARKGLASTAMVLLGFTFFTATMFAGGKLGVAFSFGEMMAVIVVGNLLLGIYAATLGYIAFKSGLNSVLMGRFCFGEVGSKLSDLILGFTQIGWYAWGTATAAVVLGKYFELSEGTVLGLLVPYLILLGTVIPPIGGVIMADFFYRYRGQYPRLADARLPAFNGSGLGAYAVGTVAAFSSPWVAPLVGIAAAALTYVLLTAVLGARTANAPLQDL